VKPRVICAALGLLLATSVLATSGPSGASTSASSASSKAPLFKDLPAAVQTSKVINVGTTTAYPPYDYLPTSGSTKLIGYEVDLRAAMGKLLGVTFVNHIVTWNELIPGIEAGRFQMAMDGMGDTDPGDSNLTFVVYQKGGPDTILVLTQNAKKVKNLLSLCGKTVGGGIGSGAITRAEAVEKLCTAAGKPADIPTTFPAAPDAVLALKSGRIFSQMEDDITGPYDAKTSDGQITAISVKYNTGSFSTAYDDAIALPKGQPQLAKALQDAFNALIKDGTYGKILKEYDITDTAIKSSTIVDG
jgi:polar amino acid transport system substrate-binding protein